MNLGSDMQEMLKQKQQLRLTVLHKMYEMSGGDTHAFINGGKLYEASGASDEASFKSAIDYLEGEYLVDVKRLAGGVPALLSIQHQGVVEVESAFAKPDEATSHFMPVNVLYVNQMIGSSIQQGVSNSSQNNVYNVSSENKEQLAKFVELALRVLEENKASTPLWQEMRAEVATLHAQASSPNPKRSIIMEGLGSLARLCEGAAAGAIGIQLAAHLPHLIALFS